MCLQNLLENYEHYDDSKRKNFFFAACRMWNKNINLREADMDCLYGGTIGINDSILDKFLNKSKILRLHAILHDAGGYIRRKYGLGPGYCYALKNISINSCFLGHVSGISYCIYLKIFDSFYSQIDC